GDARAVNPLLETLKSETKQDVRQMLVFAIGEIESPEGSDGLMALLDDTRERSAVRARAVEALGKIGGALLSNQPGSQNSQLNPVDPRLTKIRAAILNALKFEAGRQATSDRLTVLLGLTAVLRTRPEGAVDVIVPFLEYSDARIVADTLNTMARLRVKQQAEQVRQFLATADPIVPANPPRVP